jgi:hypothetical protein
MAQQAAQAIAKEYDVIRKTNQGLLWPKIAENRGSFVDKSLRGK